MIRISKRKCQMAFALNLLWFVFGGFLGGLLWCVVGLLCFATLILIPWGIACFRIASFAFFPFGKDIIPVEMIGGERIFGTGLGNFVWAVFFGFWIALCYALVGISCCVSIIGIPFGIANFILCKVSFAPLGKRIVSKDIAKAARERWSKEKIDKSFSQN